MSYEKNPMNVFFSSLFPSDISLKFGPDFRDTLYNRWGYSQVWVCSEMFSASWGSADLKRLKTFGFDDSCIGVPVVCVPLAREPTFC